MQGYRRFTQDELLRGVGFRAHVGWVVLGQDLGLGFRLLDFNCSVMFRV